MWIPLEGRMEICGVETLWHLAACWISRQRNGIPMFPPRDLCPRINPQLRQVGTGPDNLGDLGVRCFLSKRGGRWLPPPTPICSHLNEGTTNREMAAAQSLTNRDKGPVWPACETAVSLFGNMIGLEKKYKTPIYHPEIRDQIRLEKA